MKVLSLFDGMSCGQIALKNIGVDVECYYASEIDVTAIQQTQLNFPDTIQLGSVVDIDATKLGYIDLLIGGSPCQSFSFAGKRVGMRTIENEEIYTLNRYLELKSQGFEFLGQSYLFWEYMRILTELRHTNPNILFLLENVEMGAKWERILSNAIGLCGVHINSALVSAQSRKRIYWTNIRTKREGLFEYIYSNIDQPEDKKIFLSDIIEHNVPQKYYLSDKKVGSIVLNNRKLFQSMFSTNVIKIDIHGNVKNNQSKASTFTAGAHSGGNHSDMDIICETIYVKEATLLGYVAIKPNECFNSSYPNSTTKRGRKIDGGKKTATLLTKGNQLTLYEGIVSGKIRLRRLTPTECSRLQTIPDWYRWNCCESQQYKMLGNGWTVDVISHILSYINNKQTINY